MSEEINCPACKFANSSEFSFCRRCGSLLEAYSSEPEQKLELALSGGIKRKMPLTLIELMIVIAIVGILAAIAIPNRPRRYGNSRQKACFANQRVLMGAVEMYNMDRNEMIHEMNETVIDLLMEGKYLKAKVACYDTPPGRYFSTGDLAKDGVVSCTRHGCPENPINLDQ